MTREAYERSLQALKEDVVRMGTRAGEAVRLAVDALLSHDAAAAGAIIAADDAIDATHLELEDRCMLLLATQQPMASDLRTIAAAFAITIDLERMADHAEGIAKATKRMARQAPVELPKQIREMGALVQEMLGDALKAFVERDTELAVRMAQKDDAVDRLRSQTFHDVLDRIIANPASVPQALELTLIAQHLERAADHITNIGERVVYMVTAEYRELNV